MSAALDLDLATLVGDMPGVPCESPGHELTHAPGPATHYARVWCDDCSLDAIKGYCEWLVLYIRANRPVQCMCGNLANALECITILGPVNG